MRIEAVHTFELGCAIDEPFGWSQDFIDRRSLTLVRLDTDSGLSGWGECGAAGTAHLIHEMLAQRVLGGNPMERNTLWQRQFHALYNGGLTGGIGASAISALDTACWDLAGKASKLPVHALLGGALRDRILVYVTGLYYGRPEGDPAVRDRLHDEVRRYLDQGFLGMKTKVGGLSLSADLRRVAGIRDLVGPDVFLMVDANQAYDAAGAVRIGRDLRDLAVHWFEEPVNAKDIEAYLRIRQAVPGLPLAGGEVLRTRFECLDYVRRQAVDILQPDVGNVGGITEQHRVTQLAEAHGVRVHPHVWGSPVMVAASLHLASVTPPAATSGTAHPFLQEPVMEYDRTPNPLRDDLARHPFRFTDGRVHVPEGPGLGVEINEDAVMRHCFRHQATHLD
jgi:D-galactarolactone cycloisomerase